MAAAQTSSAKPASAAKPAASASQPTAVIDTTAGKMNCTLFPDKAPIGVANFIGLSNGTKDWKNPVSGATKHGVPLYDGTIFHRVIPGFMIQGGDPLTKDAKMEGRWGTGGPGYQIKAEFSDRPHVRGVISMARSQNPDSAGSQFFICLGDARFLDRQYTAFGRLVRGDEVLGVIGNTPVSYGNSGEQSKPTARVGVESIAIVSAEAP